eukprot:gene1547-2991_t
MPASLRLHTFQLSMADGPQGVPQVYYQFLSEFRLMTVTNDHRDNMKDLAVILLAGGSGKRMKSSVPKQFLPLLGKPVFMHSLDLFRKMNNVRSIVIVLGESYRDDYKHLLDEDNRIRWADPGKERQDSVWNGLNQVPSTCNLVAVHDSARPLVTEDEVSRVVADGNFHGAAVLGVPMKATVKESADGSFVLRTIPRSRVWEVHTPQVIRKELLLRGFERVRIDSIEVTDDVSIIEAMGEPVKLTLGEYTNIKLTTPDDFAVAEQVLRARGVKDVTVTPPVGKGEEGKAYPCSSERYRKSLEGR